MSRVNLLKFLQAGVLRTSYRVCVPRELLIVFKSYGGRIVLPLYSLARYRRQEHPPIYLVVTDTDGAIHYRITHAK